MFLDSVALSTESVSYPPRNVILSRFIYSGMNSYGLSVFFDPVASSTESVSYLPHNRQKCLLCV